jgi:hypothetical protein
MNGTGNAVTWSVLTPIHVAMISASGEVDGPVGAKER